MLLFPLNGQVTQLLIVQALVVVEGKNENNDDNKGTIHVVVTAPSDVDAPSAVVLIFFKKLVSLQKNPMKQSNGWIKYW